MGMVIGGGDNGMHRGGVGLLRNACHLETLAGLATEDRQRHKMENGGAGWLEDRKP